MDTPGPGTGGRGGRGRSGRWPRMSGADTRAAARTSRHICNLDSRTPEAAWLYHTHRTGHWSLCTGDKVPEGFNCRELCSFLFKFTYIMTSFLTRVNSTGQPSWTGASTRPFLIKAPPENDKLHCHNALNCERSYLTVGLERVQWQETETVCGHGGQGPNNRFLLFCCSFCIEILARMTEKTASVSAIPTQG